jgi:hypothetical protein
VQIVVDSLSAQTDEARTDEAQAEGGVTLVRAERAPPQAGVVYQGVTAEFQLAGQTRIYGTVCWHDAGIVVRGSARAINHVSVSVNAPASVVVRVLDSRGRSLGDSVKSLRQATTEQIRWRAVR